MANVFRKYGGKIVKRGGKTYKTGPDGDLEEVISKEEKEILIPSFVNEGYNKDHNIQGLVYSANTSSTKDLKNKVQRKGKSKNNKKDLKNKAKFEPNKKYDNKKEKTARRIKRIIAGLLASGVLIGGYIAWKMHGDNGKDITTGEQKTTEVQPNNGVEKPSTIVDDIEEIDSVYEVIRHFKEEYIQSYNEEYKTNYSINNIEVYINSLERGVYETNEGKLVTRGSNETKTQEVLDLNGGFKENHDTNNVVQVVINEDLIMTYSYQTGEYIISGNSNNIQNDLENENVPSLEKLGISIETIRDLYNVLESDALGNKENIEDFIDIYEENVNKNNKQTKDEELDR